MKKKLTGPIITIIVLLLLGAMFVYFYISLNRVDKKLTTIQTSTITTSRKIGGIVNFINSKVQTNAQTKK